MLTYKLRKRVTRRFGQRCSLEAGFLFEGKPITFEELQFERALAYNLDITNEIVVGTPKVIEHNSSSMSSYSSSDQNKKLLKRPRNKTKSKKKTKNTWAEDEAVAKELQRFNDEFDELEDFQLLTEEAPRDFYVIKKRKRTTPKELQRNEPVVPAESSLFFSKQNSTQFTLNDTPLPQQEENLSSTICDENEIVPESPILNNSPIFKDIQEQQQFASITLKSPTLLEETTQKSIPPQVFTLDSTESVGIVQNVDVQSLSTAKEASQNLTDLTEKSSNISSSSSNLLLPKRIFSSICEEVEEGQDVIQLDSASSIQQQSCSRIQQSLSTAKEASSIYQKSSLNTAKNISSQLIEKEAISKSLGQHSSKKLSSSTLPHIFSPETFQTSHQSICDASRTQKSVDIFEGIEGPSKSVEKSFSTAKEISTRNLEELENTPPPSTSQQEQPQRQEANLNRNASIRNSRRSSLSPWRQPQEFTRVLQQCNNGYIMSWDEFLALTNFECLRKLGEGDYGEVYEMSDSKETYAMKVIQVTSENPISSILSEVFITRHLSELSAASAFSTPSFIPLVRANVVKGIYPERLIDAWKIYKEKDPVSAQNEQPTERIDNTYVVLVMANGGIDLEIYLEIPKKANKSQRFSIFYQVALSLAIAEERYSFEHRDLHYSNILISEYTCRERERQDKISFYYNGQKIEVRSHGVHASLIDYTYSRMTDEVTGYSFYVKVPVYPVEAGADYQYEIYPMMEKLNKGDWSTFHRKTNQYWLHYLYDKLFKDRRFTLKEREVFANIFDRLLKDTEKRGFETTKDFLDNEEVRKIFDRYVF
uniref:non-specific serine/threonine protein kinase n=1 Tax=Meloidogyne incognita TaxID=6306 RepID=A0A914MGS7_MELIC